MDDEAVTVTDDPEHGRYALQVGDASAGAIVYRPLRRATPTRVFVHTGVEPAFEGRGLGSTLIAGALADCRARGIAVVPQCPFVRAYLGRHPDDLDVVPVADRVAYGLPSA